MVEAYSNTPECTTQADIYYTLLVLITNLPPSCAVVMKSENLNFLEPSGPLQACKGTALPLPFITYYNCLTKDDPADSKHLHVIDIAKIKVKFSLTKTQIVSLHYMIMLQCTAQNNITLIVLLVNNQLDALFFMYLFISLLYMFRATQCSSSGESRLTRQSPTQSNIYQMMYCHNLILLMMSTGLLETCREVK